MFEAKPFDAGAFTPFESDDAGHRLRPVNWSDLVARLDAARDLRASLLSHDGEGEASFDPGSAQHIAALCECKRGINLADLVNGKADEAISGATNESAAGNDPGI
jgi:hypothetical protein